ncbi:hypothetical protein [Williamsia sp.]|uniref:hypothetical protein n=1 Tax=Williamsia sp. TaxID=1872085 RepID=UPI002F952F0F
MFSEFQRSIRVLMAVGMAVLTMTACDSAGADTSSETVGGIEGLERVPWEGGPGYWQEFESASDWTNPEFFPIGLWYGSFDTKEQVLWDKSLGINFYTGGLWEASDFKVLESADMDWVGGQINSGFDPASKNWPGRMTDDEIDGRFEDPAEGQALLQNVIDEFGGKEQFLYGNYTHMVVGEDMPLADQEKYVNDYSDVVSLDMYLYTIPFCDFPNYRGELYVNPIPESTCRSASSYGRMVDSLRARDAVDGRLQPVWNFVEVLSGAGEEESFSRYVTPEELKGAAMSSLINEARGLVWFQQSFAGPCKSSQPLRDAQVLGSGFCGDSQVRAMGEVNNLIKSLATVLNTQSYRWDAGPGTDTMLKVKDGFAYMFAMTDGTAGSRHLALPAGLTDTVEVVGEDRDITATDGSFQDEFESEAEYHVYKIALD